MLTRIIFAIILIGIILLTIKVIRISQTLAASRNAEKNTIPTEPKLLYFASAACSHCLAQEKIIGQVLKEYKSSEIMLKKYSVENHPALARQWRVITLPTTILLSDNGEVKHINNGLTSLTTLRTQLNTLNYSNFE